MSDAAHLFSVRVYYEDTDMAGIVYYANYLRYIERARSDWVRAMGIDQRHMKEEGVVFAVRHLVADYRAPAHFDEELEVRTDVVSVKRARLVLAQDVCRGDVVLFSSEVTLVCIGPGGKPVGLPAKLRLQSLSGLG